MELLAPPKHNSKVSTKSITLIAKAAFAALFMIFGFNISKGVFFREYPLFGIDYLAEVLISLVAAAFGFFTFPLMLLLSRNWLESTIAKTVTNIVSDFWDQQSKKLEESRVEKQKLLLEQQKKDFESGILVDTSVLIDGRILPIVKSGFLDNPLVVPRDVIQELQLVADSKDKIKRQRGRSGLDVLSSLKKVTKVFVTEVNGRETAVDSKLVEFAKNHKLKLITLDFNLIKVAKIAGVGILNINVLAESLKTVLLPGETVEIEIIQKGKEKKQGIGYLEDGTMVVVEDCIDKVGTKVTAQVSKLIQSKAGKMFFCTLVTNS
jgi:uncharacterized protein YacL